jgi:outer membrane lipoprotein
VLGSILQESDRMKFKLGYLAVISALLLSGCATYPEQVKVAQGTTLVSYQSATQGGVQQGTARWSGVIAKIQNNPTDTKLEVVYFESSSQGRPKVGDETPGRFVAYVKGFLDPVVYQAGKSVTVLGQLSQPEAGKVDEYQYVYPVIQQSKVYLWPKQQETRVDVIEPFPMWRAPYPYWGYGPHLRIRTTTPVGGTPEQGPTHVDNTSQGSQQR